MNARPEPPFSGFPQLVGHPDEITSDVRAALFPLGASGASGAHVEIRGWFTFGELQRLVSVWEAYRARHGLQPLNKFAVAPRYYLETYPDGSTAVKNASGEVIQWVAETTVAKDLKIERGRAIVLVAPQGFGKSAVASRLAAAHGGRVRRVDAAQLLGSAFGLERSLLGNPATLIVDGFPATTEGYDEAKRLVVSEEIYLDIKGKRGEWRATPNLIFCTEAKPTGCPDPRRFLVVDLTKREG